LLSLLFFLSLLLFPALVMLLCHAARCCCCWCWWWYLQQPASEVTMLPIPHLPLSTLQVVLLLLPVLLLLLPLSLMLLPHLAVQLLVAWNEGSGAQQSITESSQNCCLRQRNCTIDQAAPTKAAGRQEQLLF